MKNYKKTKKTKTKTGAEEENSMDQVDIDYEANKNFMEI